MSDKGSVLQKGGAGTNFEQSVQTAFLITLIIGGNVPCIASGKLTEVALQVTNRGYETDDFLAIAKSINGEHRLLVQVKHNISFTVGNQVFKEVINDFWKDYNNTSIFDKTKDKLIIVKSGLTQDERSHVKTLFNWAVNHASETDFISEVNRIKAKKDRLEVFREVLKEVNNDIDLTDKEIWEFFKCVDVLEYDFLNEGSVDKTYFFNLIKLSKRRDSTASEKEIWSSAFAYVSTLNTNGGSVTLESIKDEDFFQHFDNAQLSPYFKAVEKLKSDSKEILRPISTSIGKGENELRLPRPEVREKILQALSESQFTIVTGNPGVGKSAEIKGVIQRDFPNASVFVFRADQFNESTLANVFSSQGVNETIQDIFSCISLIPEKIIFIDSLEKLLEADLESAFKQLLALLKEHPEIKTIASSRKYAIDLILLKFSIDQKDTSIINIPLLNDDELKLVSEKFPQLNDILQNNKIKQLLRSPKYLDFSLLAISRTTDDYTNVSLTEFKDKLWNALVVDAITTKNGLHIKREEAFKEIAVKRAKEMRLFTRPDKSDAEAIACLEHDEIVFQKNNNRKYAPTHDILEDWALVKYVSSKFEESSNPNDLFNRIGNEPAIRRAFRLWIEDYLVDDSSKINDFIKATISDLSIERYWADELLVAVFKSANSNSFFSAFEKELLEDNATFFNRCIHIIKTCCKESDPKLNSSSLLLPIGSGWEETLYFIQKNITHLEPIKISILEFLSDWYYRLFFQHAKIENLELEAAKSIVLIYLKEIEDEKEFWQDQNSKNKLSILIDILFDLASISKDEIKVLFERVLYNKENKNSWRLNSFYEKVIEKCISGVGNQHLIKELPELIVNSAWGNWKYQPPKSERESDDWFGSLERHSLIDIECWGIQDKQTFFPSGIYKTPFYNLLWVHPIVGLKFIIDFINYSVEYYVNAACKYKHEISQLRVELNDGTIVELYASFELWRAYRGARTTNNVIESLLMSLEKYLLETAKLKTTRSKENIKFVFNYIYNNSNNVAPLSVLASITIAFPEEVEEAMLPLLSVRQFYEWDLDRVLIEFESLAPIDIQIPFAQKERQESNQLPHRKKYLRGLQDFIIDYQFNIRILNKKIHEIIDKLKADNQDKDIIWEKSLNEMDSRKYKIGKYDKKLNGFPVQPEYDDKVKKFVESNKESHKAESRSLSLSVQITKAYEKEEIIDFSIWLSSYEQYTSQKDLNIHYDRPVTMAVLGLRDFSTKLSRKQKIKCIGIILEAITSILQDTFDKTNSFNRNVNIMERGITLSSFHLLMQNVDSEEGENEIIAIMIHTLFAPFNNYDIDNIIKYIRETFSKQFPDEAKRIWLGLIKYSNYRKANPYYYDDYDSERLKKSKENEKIFIQQISINKNLLLDFSEINLENSEAYILARAFVITPYDTDDKDFLDFIKHFIPLLTDDLKRDENFSHKRNSQKRQFYYHSVLSSEFYLVELLLKTNSVLAKSVLDLVIDPSYHSKNRNFRGQNNLFEFSSKIPELVIYKLDEIIGNSNDEDFNQKLITHFWILWEHFFEKIKASGKQYFLDTLFLNIEWKETAKNWQPLKNKKQFYKSMIRDLGKYNALAIQNVFSTIGEKVFLPESISLLVEIFKSEPTSNIVLRHPSAERLIKRLFYNHISKIKNDKTLIEDYVWILNKMVDYGSSTAYLFRENVITYKQNI